MRVGDVRAFLDREVAERDPAEPTEELDQWQALLVRMQNAVMRFDEEALEAAYNEALAGHPVKTVMGRLVTPLLVEIGRRWARGEGSVAEEHFFAFYLRNKLGARFHHRSRNGRGPRLLMACLPGERHEIGLLLLALAANEAGYRPVILGADMPLEELAMAAEKTGSDAIILSGLMELPPELIKQDLPALVSAAAVPVLMGGSASVRCLDALRRCGIESLGADAETGLARLEQHIPVNS
jgi:methanogenic corrinoid protein MtbC1